MQCWLLAMTAITWVGAAAEVVDRTVAIVGRTAIVESEVTLQGRLEAMANGAPYVDSTEMREAVLARLIDQQLVAEDTLLTGLPSMTDEERRGALDQLRLQSFGEFSFDETLNHYHLTSEQALDFYVRQVEFTRYVDFRFRTGLTIDDQSIADLYSSKYGRVPASDAPPLNSIRSQLRQELLSAAVEQQLEQHVRQLRADTRIVRLAPIDRTASGAVEVGRR